jgi:hypothetical protein
MELVFQLVRNFKSIPHALASWRKGRTEFQTNLCGILGGKLLENESENCHAYFTEFLVRPRSHANNLKLQKLEYLLNTKVHVNFVWSLCHKIKHESKQEEQIITEKISSAISHKSMEDLRESSPSSRHSRSDAKILIEENDLVDSDCKFDPYESCFQEIVDIYEGTDSNSW